MHRAAAIADHLRAAANVGPADPSVESTAAAGHIKQQDMGQEPPAGGRRRPRIAAIVTAYFPQSHADVVVTKLIKGYTTDEGHVAPSVDVVSLYMDQTVLPAFDGLEQPGALSTSGGRNPADIGLSIAAEHGIPVYSTIRRALYEGDHHYLPGGKPSLDIDGVLLIGEHGDYPKDELGRTLYPQRYFFEQIAGVFAEVSPHPPINSYPPAQ